MKPTNIPILTAVIFFAALAVVIGHYEKNTLLFPSNLTDLGHQAVIFFFLLSGFVLTYAHVNIKDCKLTLNVSVKDFLILRLARILPAYIIGLLLSFPILIYGSFFLHTIGSSEYWSALFLTPFFLQSWYPPTAFVWNPPSWSLSVEWLFYIIFPFVIVRLSGVMKWRMLILTYVVVLIVGVAKTIALIFFSGLFKNSNYWYNFIHYFPPTYVPIFILGIALAVFLFQTQRPKWFYSTLFWLSLYVMLLIVALKEVMPRIASDALIVVPFSAFIFGCAGNVNWLTQVFSSRIFIILGESSYALYIIHHPLSRWWNLGVDKGYFGNLVPWVDFCGYLIICISMSVAIFHWIESPGRRWIRKRYVRT